MSNPYQHASAAYANTGPVVLDQRQLEANALLKAAMRLEDARNQLQPGFTAQLDEALFFNKKLWTVFAAEVADGAERLPIDLRNNIGSIAVFVFKRTFQLLATPEPDRIDALIEINRTLAAGLMTRQETDAAATAAPGTASQSNAGLTESC